MKVLLYGRLADAIDRQVDVERPEGCTVADIRRLLAIAHPQAAEALGRSRACLRDELVDDHQRLERGDQLELLPPVSGG